MMFYRVLLTCLLCLFSFNTYAQNLVIEGLLLEENSDYKIPYATLIDITTNKYGTTSQENGSFKLVLPNGSENNKIFISSLGYKDTTIVVSDILKTQRIYLSQENYELPDVVITSTKSKEVEIGDSQSSVAMLDNKTRGYQSSAGFSWGAYFKTKNKENGAHLKSFNIYIGNTGFPEAPLMLRLLEFTGEFEFSRSQPRSLFKDIHQKPIIIEASKSGWFQLDLSDLNIRIPENGIYCLLTPLDKGGKFSYETPQGLKYGASIGIYSDTKPGKNIYPVFQDKDRLSVVKRSHAPSPAVSIIINPSN